MSVMAVSLFQSTGSKFFVNTTHTMLKSWNHVFLASASGNLLNVPYFVLIFDTKFFMNTMQTISRKLESSVFGLSSPK